MKQETPYNPLDKRNLGTSVANALLSRPVFPLPPPELFIGAGEYAIYYAGEFGPYKRISQMNREHRFALPIYVGKAVPPGARKGGFGLGEEPGAALYLRLVEHGKSIAQAGNLEITDFYCRYLVCDDIWIPLGESLLIQMFQPLWNKKLDGFGNHDPGKGRYNQMCSPWDIIHPGRTWACRLKPHSKTSDELKVEIDKYLEESNVPEVIIQKPHVNMPRKK